MKRHFCAVATGLLLALVGSGTAAAGGLPGLGQLTGSQSAGFGDQSVGKQRNDADVTQSQGNGNVNISPAISVGGNASTWNAQGNDNQAKAAVGQSNTATQSQSSDQTQSSGKHASGGCCGRSQTATQDVQGGSQDVGRQKNDADVEQNQGNGNVNISPAVALGGDASTWNAQGDGNTATTYVGQSNAADQSQSATQGQSFGQDGLGGGCCNGQSQAGSQSTSFGDQSVGTQKNDADVTQNQGNGNLNISPAVAIGGDATTFNSQGNGNTASTVVGQSNDVSQSQSAKQFQGTVPTGGGCCNRPPDTGNHCLHHCKHLHPAPKHHCQRPDRPTGAIPTGTQSAQFGDQSVGEQKNTADVTQFQGNGDANVSPAVALGGKPCEACSRNCGSKKQHCSSRSGDASTRNAQGNRNTAVAYVLQSNRVDQSQSSTQRQGYRPFEGVTPA